MLIKIKTQSPKSPVLPKTGGQNEQEHLIADINFVENLKLFQNSSDNLTATIKDNIYYDSNLNSLLYNFNMQAINGLSDLQTAIKQDASIFDDILKISQFFNSSLSATNALWANIYFKQLSANTFDLMSDVLIKWAKTDSHYKENAKFADSTVVTYNEITGETSYTIYTATVREWI